MFCLGLTLSALVALTSAGFTETVGPGEWLWFQSENYPEDPSLGAKDTWKITSSPGSRMKLYCTDFRFIYTDEDPCALGKMEFNMGNEVITKCAVQNDLLLESDGNEITVNLISDENGGGIFECAVKEIGDSVAVEEVILGPEEKSKKFEFPEVDGGDDDQTWEISAANGEEIRLYCGISVSQEVNGKCNMDYVKVTYGDKTETVCGATTLQVVSTKITLSAEVFPQSQGLMHCQVDLVEKE